MMVAGTLHVDESSSRIRQTATSIRPQVRVLAFACVFAIMTALLLLVTPGATTMPERSWTMPFFALVIAFGLAEGTALHVEIRKESHSLSLSGIPMMFGLLYLSPVLLATAYFFGSVPTMLWDGRVALLTAFLAGFGRAIAEVGAVIIVGGNINHVTRVMTTTIALETSKGNLVLALALGGILIGIALAVTAAVSALAGNKGAEQLRHA